MSELSLQSLTCFFSNVDKLIASKHTIAYHQKIVQLKLEISESSYNISRSFSAVRKRQDCCMSQKRELETAMRMENTNSEKIVL